MKLYYMFGFSDIKDYEYTAHNLTVANFLKTITNFTTEEIMRNFDVFANIFRTKIYEHFKCDALEQFKFEPELEGKRIESFLKNKELSKRARQNFLKREALKKKGMAE